MSSDALVITGWSAISAFGLGADAFAGGLREGRSGVRPLAAAGTGSGEGGLGPFEQGGAVPGFEVAEVLGKKGTRSMDRVTALTVAASGLLLESAGPGLTDDPDSVGMVLGTGSGSVQSIMDFTRDGLTGDKPYHVDPALFPNTVMNRMAGLSAIWHGLRGPNATVAAGALTGLSALNYTARLQRCGHAGTMLCGAAEELTPRRAWLEWRATGGDAAPIGEGCAMFLLESAADAERGGRAALATVLGFGFAAAGPELSLREALVRCVRGALDRAGRDAADVRLVAPSDAQGREGKEERAALDEVAGGAVPAVHCREAIGDTGAASAAFQLAAVLAGAADRPGLALVTSVDRAEGTAGCALFDLPAAAGGGREKGE
ncbi:beta-ketoacyl synthase N-terminal-like domain-containing protein [Actinomadura sp. 1N219]|uniref:beta-ketoacyl synthase N-terminal-like domain-containing protein n=1 Tax=Actinomadura sp. 1N219 TaxID=3375152 RepID=UPI003791292E